MLDLSHADLTMWFEVSFKSRCSDGWNAGSPLPWSRAELMHLSPLGGTLQAALATTAAAVA